MEDLAQVTPMHVAGYVEQLSRTHSKPTVKQHLAALRMLFDWLVTGQVMPANPAHAVRGPKHSVRKGKISVLSAEEMHELLAAIDTTSLLGLRDRALIGLMGYTFARVGAAVGIKVQDFYVQYRRGWVRLHEKGGKVTELPCHHNLDQYLEDWLTVSGLGSEPEAPLFPTLRHGRLTGRTSLSQANVHMMIQRRAKAAGLRTKISAHSFRATGITTKVVDFGHRGVHLTALRGKTVVEAYYGKSASKAYFDSCSDGGREALMEAQRYPEDYDGILAGAPANFWTHMVASGVDVQKTLMADPAGAISAMKLPAITRAVLEACDARGRGEGWGAERSAALQL